MEKLQTEHGIFTANEITGQSAEDVYQEWLQNKGKPPKPSNDERLKALEQAMLDLILGGE